MQHSNSQPNPRPRHPASPDQIVFPEATVTCKPDAQVPTLEPDGDLILDPYGQLFCFVCRVNVPKGVSNISQHLEGKKHETNNKVFVSLSEKKIIRERYVIAANEQRKNGPPSDAIHQDSVPVGPSSSSIAPSAPPVVSGPASQTPHTAAVSASKPTANKSTSSSEAPAVKTRETTKKALRKELASKFEKFNIDKNAYLDSLISEPDENGEGNEAIDVEEQTLDFVDDVTKDKSALMGLGNRQRPFGPLMFKPPEGPDYFFESMAAETEATGMAASIRDLLSASDSAGNSIRDVETSVTDSGARSQTKDASAKTERTIDKGGELGEFIKLSNEKNDIEEDQEAEREKADKRAAQPPQIFRDSNGEELPPWLLDPDATENVLYSSDSSVALHFEILEFLRFVSPVEAELNSRNEMVMMVESITRSLWPSSTAVVFGSYATGLYLPTSDIDMCVLGTPGGGEMKELEQLAEAVRNVSGFARRVHVIRAKVPLVKVISRKTSMNCDISIGQGNGPKVVPLIKKYLKDYPALRPLLLVIKCFLHQRDLNEVFTGGLGSYTIFLLVVSHLQMFKYNFPDLKTNLGAVLQSFFQLYGRMFNLCIAGIQVKDNGSYYDKFDKYSTMPRETLRFSVEDPNDESNELGKNGYGAMKVRKAFNNASMTLVKWRRNDSNAAPTPLGSILHVDDDLRIRRASVMEDMQRKGQNPLGYSINEADPESKHAVGVRSQHSNGAGRDGSTADNSHSASRSRDQESTHRNSRGLRDRDPRLVKRRRSDPGQELERPQSSAKVSSQSNPWYGNRARSNMQYTHTNSVNQQNRVSQTDSIRNGSASTRNPMYQSTETNYSGGISFDDQTNYSKYPPRQFPVSTPGYQYVNQQQYDGGVVASPAVYPNPGFVPYAQTRQSMQQMADGRSRQSSKNQVYNEQAYDSSSRRGHGKKRASFGRGTSNRRH